MPFIFFSHASEDKLTRVRPLVEVMIAEGEPVWIDRPGMGSGNVGFNQASISRHGIDLHGLLDLGKDQASVIDCEPLGEALRAKASASVEAISRPLKEWEKVRNLIASVNRVRTSHARCVSKI